MIAYILNRYATRTENNFVKDFAEIDGYTYVSDYDYKGNSTVVIHKQPNALEGDFLFVCEHAPIYTLTMDNGDVLTMDNGDLLTTDTLQGALFGGVISKISKSNGIYTITVDEMAALLSEDVFVTNWSTARSLGLEDFFLSNIETYFRDETFPKFNNDYISFGIGTHTQYGGTLETNDGIMNISEKLADFLQSKQIRLKWSIGSESIYCEMYRDSTSIGLNVSFPYVSEYTEEVTSAVLSRLYVKWKDTSGTGYTYSYTYVMDGNGQVLLQSQATSRIEGYSSALYVEGGTSDELLTKIQEQFSKNQYKHKVVLKMQDSDIVSRDDIWPGKKVNVVLSDGTMERSIINKVTMPSNSNVYTVELGNLEVTLTDKLRRLI